MPYAVGIGYAIGYGLGPYMAYVRQELGAFGHTMLLLAVIVVAVLLAWRMIMRIIRRGVMLALMTRLRGRARL